MTTFCQASRPEQSALMICLFFSLVWCQIYLIALSDKEGCAAEKGLFAVLLAALMLLLTVLRDAFQNLAEGRPAGGLPAPMWVLWMIAGAIGVLLAVRTISRFRGGKQSAGRDAVKQAIDTLPGAICYFAPSGIVKLCNLQMHRLFRSLAQSDLQTFDELQSALEACDEKTGVIRLADEGQTFLFPDGKAWRFDQNRVRASDGVVYTEVIFSDVTEQYEKGLKLREQTRQFEKLSRELKYFSDNVAALAREKEVLSAKTKLHDQMGAGMLAVRKVLQQSDLPEETVNAIQLFQKSVSIIKNDNEYSLEKGGLEEFMKDADTIGVRVELTGELPQSGEPRRIFVMAMRECLTNSVRHADATALFIESSCRDGQHILRVTNDGRRPGGAVVPKGGLLNLNRYVSGVGGVMEIQSDPVFALTVTVPAREEAV